jgi:RNA ligase (TIGR02306 family)
MSTFACNVVEIDSVDHHPNADRLSLVRIGGFVCISAKLEDGSHRYAAGDLVVYIPEAAILPEWMLKQMDFWKDDKGTLAGSAGNRVKAIKLRNIVSQGVLYQLEHKMSGWVLNADGDRVRQVVQLGDDVSELLGVVKYEPPVPTSMAGEIESLFGKTVKFDVENYQRYPNIFKPSEPVIATEKLHGTFAAFCFWPGLDNSELLNGEWFAYSKGLGSQGLVFKNNKANANNLYQRYLVNGGIVEKLEEHFNKVWGAQRMNAFTYSRQWPITILGEIFGRGVQDLAYGQTAPSFRVFDVYVGEPGSGFFLPWEELVAWCEQVGLDMVPVLYEGAFDETALVALRDGKDAISNSNVREGIVIKSTTNRTCDELGRVMLKMVSPDYLLRKNGTEYN